MSLTDGVDFAQIAQDAGVDQTVVWQMLINGMRDVAPGDIVRVQAALDRAGLSAKSVQGYRQDIAGSVLVLLPRQLYLNEFQERVDQAFKHAAARNRIEVVRYDQTHNSVPDLVSLFRAFDAIGMVGTSHTRALVDACIAASRPYVMVESDFDGLTEWGRRITVDNAGAVREIMGHLLSLGHRRIGHISGNWGYPSAQERLAAYRRALRDAGIPLADELVIRGDWSEDAGYEGARALLSLAEPPTAIFAANDMIAFGAIRAALEKKRRVPEDLSVAGFDDIAISASFSPPLTTVRQEADAMGRLACDYVQQWLQGTPPPQQVTIFPARLIVRQSTGPVPGL